MVSRTAHGGRFAESGGSAVRTHMPYLNNAALRKAYQQAGLDDDPKRLRKRHRRWMSRGARIFLVVLGAVVLIAVCMSFADHASGTFLSRPPVVRREQTVSEYWHPFDAPTGIQLSKFHTRGNMTEEAARVLEELGFLQSMDQLTNLHREIFNEYYLQSEKVWPPSGEIGGPRAQRLKDALADAVHEYSESDVLRVGAKYFNSIAVNPRATALPDGSIQRCDDCWQMHGLLGYLPNGVSPWLSGPQPEDISSKSDEEKKPFLADGGFYLALSDHLPLDRVTLDGREPVCQTAMYDLASLPDVAVIITFHNEPQSTLLRTVHSILNVTPPELLREIILVDDRSNRQGCRAGEGLDEYITLLPKVKLMRLPRRMGLVPARLAGIRATRAPVFVIADSHIEMNTGWLEPLLSRLVDSPESLVFPRIDAINESTFDYIRNAGIGAYVSFKWSVVERSVVNENVTNLDPVPSAASAGGVWAMRKDWFEDLGGYDEEFSMWGAENVELPFRVWQCGGRVEGIPCSRTYHVYRKDGHNYRSMTGSLTNNKYRTARLWFGDMYSLARAAIGGDSEEIEKFENGNFDRMLEVKDRLGCRTDFMWILKNLTPSPIEFINSLDDIAAMGDFRVDNQCIDSFNHKEEGEDVGTFWCHGQGGNQAFALLTSGIIRSLFNNDQCVFMEEDAKAIFKGCRPHLKSIRDGGSRWYPKWLSSTGSRQSLELRWCKESEDLERCKCLMQESGNLKLSDCGTWQSQWEVHPKEHFFRKNVLEYSEGYTKRRARARHRVETGDPDYVFHVEGTGSDLETI